SRKATSTRARHGRTSAGRCPRRAPSATSSPSGSSSGSRKASRRSSSNRSNDRDPSHLRLLPEATRGQVDVAHGRGRRVSEEVDMDPVRLSQELLLLEAIVADRLAGYLDPSGPPARRLDDYGVDGAEFAGVAGGRELTREEHVLVLLALVPHVRAEFFARLI